jgi:aldehyde:ferredoxin oxidoreductase
MFSVRRGISRKDDITIPNFYQRLEGGTRICPESGIMLNRYYSVRGWDKEGIPTREKLTELGL